MMARATTAPPPGGPPRPSTHFTSDKIFWFDWSPDGRLALSRGTRQTDAVLIKNFQCWERRLGLTGFWRRWEAVAVDCLPRRGAWNEPHA